MKILVGYDGSNAAKEAVNVAVKHAKGFDSEIQLVTSKKGGKETEEGEIIEATKGLKDIEQFLKTEGVKAETHLLVRGMSPGEDLVSFAKEQKIDEIVVGVKRRSKVGKVLFGSNAQFVVLNAPCAVVTVK